MENMGIKIASKRKETGMTQIEFAEKLSVTRQTVSRWESGSVLPDIDKIPDIASLLGVSCDYLLRDDNDVCDPVGSVTQPPRIGRVLEGIKGKKVKLNFCDEEADIDLYDLVVTVVDFEGNWMKITAITKKHETIEKLIPVSSILSFEIVKEN